MKGIALRRQFGIAQLSCRTARGKKTQSRPVGLFATRMPVYGLVGDIQAAPLEAVQRLPSLFPCKFAAQTFVVDQVGRHDETGDVLAYDRVSLYYGV